MQEANSRPATDSSNPAQTARVSAGGALAQPRVSLLLEWEPWHRAFFRRISEFFNPPKLPPLQLTSKPVAVKDMWGDYRKSKMATPTSILVHALVVAVLVIPFGTKVVQVVKHDVIFMPDMSPY